MNNTANKKHVTFVLPSLVFGGGIESHTLKLFRHFDRNRFSFSLITLFDHPERPDLYNDVPSDIRVIRLTSKGLGHIGTWASLIRALRALKPDTVVSSMFSPNTAVRVLKPLFGYRVITREHNTYEEKKLYHRGIDLGLSFFSDVIVAVASDVADFTSRQSFIPRKKFTVINNGVDIEAIDTFLKSAEGDVVRVRKEIGLSEGEKIVLNVARIKPTKDHRLLIDAFELFAETHPNYHLVIVGDGSERPVVEQHIQSKKHASRVHLLGYRKDVFAWFAAADMFVLSSKREGFPNVGIEAVAFGLPFISTKVSGASDIIEEGKNGSVVSMRTPEALALSMAHFADMDVRERTRIQEISKASAQRFDINVVTQRYEELF